MIYTRFESIVSDGREYDAFISYKSTPADEKFVLQYLFPKLEAEMRFKLCLHFRDFLPGEGLLKLSNLCSLSSHIDCRANIVGLHLETDLSLAA